MIARAKANDPADSWRTLLSAGIPAEGGVGLLRLLLWEGQAAREQWTRWTETVADPRAYFEREFYGRKGLLPLLSHRISVAGIEPDPSFATYARVAQVREELRGRIFIESLVAVQAAMDAAGVETILINGAGYAFTVYDEPWVRHSHGIDLVVSARLTQNAAAAASHAGFRPVSVRAVPGGTLALHRHPSGLELTLRSALFTAPHVSRESTDFAARCLETDVAGARVRVLAPVDRLCHTLGESAWSPTRRNLRWACDAYLLLARSDPAEFDSLAAMADQLGLSLPLAVLLEFMRQDLSVGVPAPMLNALWRAGISTSVARAPLLLSSVLRASGSVGTFVQAVRANPVLCRKALPFALFPSIEHMLYLRPIRRRWTVTLSYLARIARVPLRPLLRGGALRRRSLRSHLWQAAEHGDVIHGGGGK